MAIEIGTRYTFEDYGTRFPKGNRCAGIDSYRGVILYTANRYALLKAFSVIGLVPSFGTRALVQAVSGSNTSSSYDVARLSDRYGVSYVGNSVAGGLKLRAFDIGTSGTTITQGAATTVSMGYAYPIYAMCKMSATKVLAMSSGSFSYQVTRAVVGDVNTGTLAITIGSYYDLSVHQTGATRASLDSFNETYAVYVKQAGYLLILSISGTAVTYESNYYDATKPFFNVKCFGEDKFVALYMSYVSSGVYYLRATLFSRSGTVITEEDDIGVFSTMSRYYLDDAEIIKEDDDKFIVIFHDAGNHKIYTEQIEIKGDNFKKVLNNYEIEVFATYSGTAHAIVGGSYFPGATDPSAYFVYDYLETNYQGGLRVGNPTWGGFKPKVMLI